MPSTPFSLGSLSLKNRLVLAPMTTYSSRPDGVIDPAEIAYLQRRAESGFGAIMTAACYVHKTGHAFPGQWRCDADDVIESSLRPVAQAIQAGGSKAILQIHHGGRQCPANLSSKVLSASAIPTERPNAAMPSAMTLDEIETIIQAFGDAARRAEKAGYDAVEIHGANTYLLQQFVSPGSNQREDEYGQDRLLFAARVSERVLASVSEGFPVGYRFSPEEVENPGITFAETEALIERLCDYPLAFLHVSLGKYNGTSLRGEFENPIVTRIARVLNGRIPLIGVGSVKTLEDARGCLELGADLVAVGRAAITDPDWAGKVLRGETPSIKFPREGAAEKLVLPEGLVNRVLGAPGWFEMED